MKKTCETCGGAGQISYFKGVSRFLLSSEECPECSGFGYIIADDDDARSTDSVHDKKNDSGRKKK